MAKYYVNFEDAYVYMLFDNKKQVPIYIGVTKDLTKRIGAHKGKLLKDYENKHFVTLEVIEKIKEDLAANVEQYWMWQFRSWGFRLLNKINTAHYGLSCSQEVNKEYEKGGYIYTETVDTMQWKHFLYSESPSDKDWAYWKKIRGFKRTKKKICTPCSQLPKKRID